MQGTIKFQCTDRNGLYSWEKRNCKLDVELGTFEIFGMLDNDLQKELVSLGEAKFAKEWSFSSALSGFGFDILWNSGKVWSFLVDDESSCSEWVKQINLSITKNSSSNENYNGVSPKQIINEIIAFDNGESSEIVKSNRSKLESIIEEHKTFLSSSSQPPNNEHRYDPLASVPDTYFPSVPNQSIREPSLTIPSTINRHNQQLITSTIVDDDESPIFPNINKAIQDPLQFGDSMEVLRDTFISSYSGAQAASVDRYGVQEHKQTLSEKLGTQKDFESIFESDKHFTNYYQDKGSSETKIDTSKLNLGSSVRSVDTEKERFTFQGQQVSETHKDFYNPSSTINLSSASVHGSNSYGLAQQISVGKVSQPSIKSLDTIYTYQALIKSLQMK
jgi:hypothetical protein